MYIFSFVYFGSHLVALGDTTGTDAEVGSLVVHIRLGKDHEIPTIEPVPLAIKRVL